MAQIFKNLQDPAWWFTVVVMALIMGVAAAFLYDRVSSVASKYSLRIRRKRHTRLVAIAKEIRALKSDSRLLIAHGIDLVIRLITISFIIFLALIIQPFIQFYEDYPKYDPFIMYRLPGSELVKPITGLIVILAIIIISLIAFLTHRKIVLFQRVNLELRRLYKLPRI